MALTLCLWPTENLVVDGAPKCKRVEFTPEEIELAVKAGGELEIKGETVTGATGTGQYPLLHSSIRFQRAIWNFFSWALMYGSQISPHTS